MTTTLQIESAKFDLVKYIERKVGYVLQQAMHNQQNEVITTKWVDWPEKDDDNGTEASKSEGNDPSE